MNAKGRLKGRETRVDDLRRQLKGLPLGNLTRKSISGKKRCYRQWTENGQHFCRYVRKAEEEILAQQIALRKKLESELAALLPKDAVIPPRGDGMRRFDFTTDVKIGAELREWAEVAAGYGRRDRFGDIMKYLRFRAEDRVLILYGLRRTGKTTLLRQAVLALTDEEFARAAYLKPKVGDTLADVNRDLKELKRQGFRFAFIDEVTLLEDFIDGAALFSDVYCGGGMKIVLSGTDSLGFWCSAKEALYDRAYLIHTSIIPFREHARLLKTDDVDEYIRFGGMLQAGELAFDDPDALADDASFRTDESARRYIDTAICRNIQHSLKCFDAGGHFRDLVELYRADELTNAVNRVIEDMNHAFVVEVFERDFVSHDFGSAAQQLRSARDPKRRTDVLDNVSRANVTKRLKRVLDIRDRAERNTAVSSICAAEIREYLQALDLVSTCRVRSAVLHAPDRERIVITQPGMRFVQAQALVFALAGDVFFSVQEEPLRQLVEKTILDDVAGRMLDDIVLFETSRVFASHKGGAPCGTEVFKLEFAAGEFDMVVRTPSGCRLYEVKHSEKIDPGQTRHLTDRRKLDWVRRNLGEILSREVLYRGPNATTPGGIVYRNVGDYLKGL